MSGSNSKAILNLFLNDIEVLLIVIVYLKFILEIVDICFKKWHIMILKP